MENTTNERVADAATNRVADYVCKLGVKISILSKATGISDGMLRRSISMKERSLRADEFLKICGFLEKEPFDFAPAGSTPHEQERYAAGQQEGA